MKRGVRTMPAGEFKAKCLAVLDEVAVSRRELVITKRGKPVAKVVALSNSPEPAVEKLIAYQGDLLSPIDLAWDAAK
jgi:prevent-host-death family protein